MLFPQRVPRHWVENWWWENDTTALVALVIPQPKRTGGLMPKPLTLPWQLGVRVQRSGLSGT